MLSGPRPQTPLHRCQISYSWHHARARLCFPFERGFKAIQSRMTLTQIDAMALTLIIEATVALSIARLFGVSAASAALSAMLGSSLTHPTLWWVFYPAQTVLGALTTPVLEIAVFLSEATFYKFIAPTQWSTAILMSLLVNAASWGAGEIIYRCL